MSFVRYVALRYLFGKHRISYIVFISRTAIIGMALGVTTLMLALAILRGFEEVITTKIVGFDSHIRIEQLFDSVEPLADSIVTQIGAIEGVEQIFPIRRGEIMLQADGRTEGAILESMPLTALSQLESVSSSLTQSDYSLNEGLILGKILGDRLGVGPGDYLLVYHLDENTTVSNFPDMAQVRVAALYESGMSDYDKIYVYSSLETATSFMNSQVDQYRYGMFLEDLGLTRTVVASIDQFLPYSYLTVSWRDRHETLFNWMRTQQLPILIIFSLIMLVAVVNIASTLVLIILEKRREIGTLRALGTSRKSVIQIFAIEGLTLGVIGAGAGIVLALVLGWIQLQFGLISLPSDVYFMDQVAIQFSFWDTLFIGGLVLMLALLSSLIPAWQAARQSPSESLRYE